MRSKGLNPKEMGSRAEREVKKILEKAGFYCVKSAGSSGFWDIWAINEGKVRLIQVKATSSPLKATTLFKKDIEKMKSIKIAGQQELWIKRKGHKVSDPFLRYEIIRIKKCQPKKK